MISSDIDLARIVTQAEGYLQMKPVKLKTV